MEAAKTIAEVGGQVTAPPPPEEVRQPSDGFTAPTPWEDVSADCLVVTCSDHRFWTQVGEFIESLDYKHPHVLSFPSGIALAHPLITTLGFLAKGIDKLLEKALDVTQVKEVICIAHENCGVYGAGKIKLVDTLSRNLRGKSVREIQCDHVLKSVGRLRSAFRDIRVRAFYADVDRNGSDCRVTFRAIK